MWEFLWQCPFKLSTPAIFICEPSGWFWQADLEVLCCELVVSDAAVQGWIVVVQPKTGVPAHRSWWEFLGTAVAPRPPSQGTMASVSLLSAVHSCSLHLKFLSLAPSQVFVSILSRCWCWLCNLCFISLNNTWQSLSHRWFSLLNSHVCLPFSNDVCLWYVSQCRTSVGVLPVLL